MFPHVLRVRILVLVVLIPFVSVGYTQLVLAKTQAEHLARKIPQLMPDSIARATVDINLDSDAALLVFLGLSIKINDSIAATLSEQLTGMSVEFVQSSATPSSKLPANPDITALIGAGTSGCESAVRYSGSAPVKAPVVCILLTREKFAQIQASTELHLRSNLTAIVIDQPVSRQAEIASRVYPALLSYTTLKLKSGALLSTQPSEQLPDAISAYSYRDDQALAIQLTQSLSSHDALIATVESAIFNRDTLRTVLLTAYGYGKPVIGLSRAYVRAGALITAYSTPEQIVRQLAELLVSDDQEGVSDTPSHTASDASSEDKSDSIVPLPVSVLYPRYFSVVDNSSVAKSLGLNKALNFNANETYVDGDFRR